MTSETPHTSAQPEEPPATGPLPFSVTGAGDLKLAADRTGTTTFTVTNLTGRPIRVRLQPKSSDPTHDGWYKVAGDPEVSMTVGATITVDVKASVPSDAPAGQDSLHLRAVDEADPEQLTDGQPVAVAIPDPPAPPKKAPFLLIGIIALVVLLVGGGAIWWFLLRGNDAPVATAPPTISGTPTVGQILTATPGTWTGADTTELQWYACTSPSQCTAIAGADGPQYQLTATDAGRQIKVTVTATGKGGSTDADSTLTEKVVGPPTNTTPPTITGNARTESLLTATNGEWSDAASFAIQWYACPTPTTCVAITGATGTGFQVTANQVGVPLKVTVTATGPAGTASADSAFTEDVRPVVPNVSSFTASYAKSLLASYGLQGVVVNDIFNSPCSLVQTESPGAGTLSTKGATITLLVSYRPANICAIYTKAPYRVNATAMPIPTTGS